MVMITIEEMKEKAPSIFTVTKADHLTEKYTQTPTIVVVQDLINLGWDVTSVQEVKTKKNKGFQKHMVVFRNNNILVKGQEGDDVYPQIILTNSHDGKNAFNFRVGLFRLICSNGLVISDKDFADISIRHINYTFENLRETINTVITNIPNIVHKINLFKNKQMSDDEILSFAQKALLLRTKGKTDMNEFIMPKRKADEGKDLWCIYNLVQEKLLKGEYNYGNKMRKAREIKKFQKDIELNEKLYELASEFLN